MKKSVILLIAICLTSLSLAQTRYFGIVKDQEQKPISDVLVYDGINQSRSAADGSWSILSSADSLHFSIIGFEKQSIPISPSPIIITMISKPIELNPIIVSETYNSDYFSSTDRYTVKINPQTGNQNTASMLATASGVHSVNAALFGERQSISLLGNLSRHTLVLLDGIPLNSSGEAFDLSRLNPENIEKIEIIKNNASAYGGSSAIGGIILITSKNPGIVSETFAGFRQESGSYEYLKNSIRFSSVSPHLSYRIGLSKQKADNNFTYSLPSWWNPDSLIVLERTNNKKTQSSFNANITGRYKGFGANYNAAFDQFYRQLPGPVNFLEIYQNAFLSGINLKQNIRLDWMKKNRSIYTMGWLNDDYTLYDNTSAPLPVYVAKYRQALQNSGFKLGISQKYHSFKADLGFDKIVTYYLNKDEIRPLNTIEKRIYSNSVYSKLSQDHNLGLWKLSGALATRYDRAFQADHYTWRTEALASYIGLVSVDFGGTLGTSYSLPSVYDLYWKGDAQAIGNPHLKAESSQGYQFWVDGRLDALRVKLGYHNNEIENMIQWQQVSMNGPTWKPFNIQAAHIRNLEIETSLSPYEWLELSATGLITEALDKSRNSSGIPVNTKLIYTPEKIVGIKLALYHENITWWISHKYTGKQWSTRDNLISPLPSYQLVDTGLSYNLVQKAFSLSPYITINNLLDIDYQVHAYVPQPGINWIAGLSFDLKL